MPYLRHEEDSDSDSDLATVGANAAHTDGDSACYLQHYILYNAIPYYPTDLQETVHVAPAWT